MQEWLLAHLFEIIILCGGGIYIGVTQGTRYSELKKGFIKHLESDTAHSNRKDFKEHLASNTPHVVCLEHTKAITDFTKSLDGLTEKISTLDDRIYALATAVKANGVKA